MILRRPGELPYVYISLLIGAGVAAFGLLEGDGARPIAYVSIFFGAIALLLIWIRQGGGIYVTPAAVTYHDGRKRLEICATPPVVKVLVLRVGSMWENYEEIRFLDETGAHLGKFKNEVQTGRSGSTWSHADLRSFAAANHWDCEIDPSKDHLTRPAPASGDDDS